MDLKEFQIDPGLFLLVVALFVFSAISSDAGSGSPSHKACGDRRKPRRPRRSPRGRWNPPGSTREAELERPVTFLRGVIEGELQPVGCRSQTFLLLLIIVLLS